MTTSKNPTESIMETCFMQATPCLYSHVYALQNRKDEYLSTLATLCHKGLIASTTQAIKARIIAALHIVGEHGALKRLMPHCDVVEIVKALSMLDRPRQMRQFQRKVQMIETRHPHVLEDLPDENLGENDQSQSLRRTSRRQRSIVKELGVDGRAMRRHRHKGLRRLRKHIKDIESQGDHLHISTCPFASTAHVDTAVKEMIESSSVSGALSLKIREWARTRLTSDFLEFVVLSMPVDQWKRLADLVHFHPDDFALPYFLGFIHGGELPDDSFVKDMREFLKAPWESRPAAFLSLVERHPQLYLNYAYLRTQPEVMKGHSIILEMLARNIPLDTAIWYLEELASQSPNDVIPNLISTRIKSEDLLLMSAGSKVTSFGKLVERILTFQSRKWRHLAEALMPVAEQRLSALKEEWSATGTSTTSTQTVVFGDASSSMTTAIQAATILASMISVCLDGELLFFHSVAQPSPHPRPKTLQQVLEVCQKVRATGCTSLAAALWPYYQAKRIVDRIVMVTDEEENTQCNGYMFAPLLRLYKEEINANVQLIIVGVGSGDRQFQKSLADCGIAYKRMEIDNCRPDLSKFDALLGQIAMTSGDITAVADEEAVEGVEEFVVV